jgi:hypothetical protein
MRRQSFSWVFAAGLLAAAPSAAAEAGGRPEYRVTVSARRAWTNTGLDVSAGQPLHIEAEGSVWIAGLGLKDWLLGRARDRRVGPGGTYVWPRRYQPTGPFPIPAMADGPAPAFGLIGQIGEGGVPFTVGARYDGTAATEGRLWLGLNDDRFSDNRGHFRAVIRLAAEPTPQSPRPPVIAPGERTGHPVPGARVLLIYVDGLRPDVLREMAEAGFLPHFKSAFLDRGVECPWASTVFPSNTLIANGSLFTGLFSDRTGIKSQNQFERSTLKPRGQLSAWLPDGFIPMPPTRVLNLLDKYAPEQTHAFLIKRQVPTLASRLDKAFKFTTLPIAPLNPPPQWLHRAVNTIGPFGLSTKLPWRLDGVNAQYAVEELLGDPEARIIAVWFPMADKTCHHSGRGQFGAARRDLALADRYLGRILARLRQVRWEESTYLVLVSDHGHLGGEASVNQACNLPRDWAHRRLGCNVRVVGQEWTHPGIDESRFFFFDNQGAGQAKLFLPYGSYFRGPWRRNRLYELTRYELRPAQPPVNLLESLTEFPAVDLILVKLDDRRTFLYRDEDRQAILHRTTDTAGQERYRYEPVRRLTQSSNGDLHYDPPSPSLDPLGYLQDPHFLSATVPGWIDSPRTAAEWLEATARTPYPDAVVAMAKFFAWAPPVADLADVRDPDLVVTAAEGWSFRSDDGEGTDHGYPLAPSMRMSLFLAGPNIRAGVLMAPQRIVDVMPTLLEMVGWPYDPSELDGRAITGIYD